MAPTKRVLVVIRRPLRSGKAAQGLRSAVAYAAVGLDVTVALCAGETETSEFETTDAAVARPLQTLRALGRRVITVDAEALCALLAEPSFHAAILW